MTEQESTSKPADGTFVLTEDERQILKSFARQYRRRHFIRGVLVLIIVYCFVAGGTSAYYAVQMFRGHDVLNTQRTFGTGGGQTVEQSLNRLRPFIERVNFFNIGWTSILHTALLGYIALRMTNLLRRWKHRNPRAALVMKLARRLDELGQIDLERLQ